MKHADDGCNLKDKHIRQIYSETNGFFQHLPILRDFLWNKWSYQRGFLGQLFVWMYHSGLSIGHIPADPGRQVYYPATYRDIHPERGQHCQTQARSTAQQTWPGRANKMAQIHVRPTDGQLFQDSILERGWIYLCKNLSCGYKQNSWTGYTRISEF